MKKSRVRLLSLVLALIMVFSLISVGAYAEELEGEEDAELSEVPEPSIETAAELPELALDTLDDEMYAQDSENPYTENLYMAMDLEKAIINTYFYDVEPDQVIDKVVTFDLTTLNSLENDYCSFIYYASMLNEEEIMLIYSDGMFSYLADMDTALEEGYKAVYAAEETWEALGAENNEPVEDAVCRHVFSRWSVSSPAGVGLVGAETRACTLCGLVETREIPALIEYSILNGANQTVSSSGSDPIVIRSEGALGKFLSLELDGETVSRSCYTLTEGSTIVTFPAEYAATLGIGIHGVVFRFEDGLSMTTLTVDGLASPMEGVEYSAPQTAVSVAPEEPSTAELAEDVLAQGETSAAKSEEPTARRSVSRSAVLAKKNIQSTAVTTVEKKSEPQAEGISTAAWLIPLLAALSIGTAFVLARRKAARKK